MDANRFYAVRDSYQIPATIVAGGGGIAVGRGVDMTDPQYPLLVPDVTRFFSEPMLLMGAAPDEGYEVTGDAIKDTFALLQSDTEQSEAATLNTYFRGSYSVSNLSVALARAREFRRVSHSAYVLLTHRGDSRVMTPQHWQVREDLRPLAEDIDDDETAFTQFRRDFGTHYIHAVTYGLTIAIRGSLRSTNEQERLSLGTRLKAGFGAFKAEAGVDATTRNQLQSGNLDLTCEVNCGGTVPARPLMMSSFEEIATFLNEIGDGRIRFKLAPVDTNLYPGGFNNLNPDFEPLCVQAAMTAIEKACPDARGLVLIPENHTRNQFYLQNVATLARIMRQAGIERSIRPSPGAQAVSCHSSQGWCRGSTPAAANRSCSASASAAIRTCERSSSMGRGPWCEPPSITTTP